MTKFLERINTMSISAHFHHVGLACEDIEKTRESLACLFPDVISSSEIIHDEGLQAYVQLVKLDNGSFFEFVSGDIVKSFIKKNVFQYHCCFEVDLLDHLTKNTCFTEFLAITPAKPAKLFDGRRVQFFHTPIGIVEMLERN